MKDELKDEFLLGQRFIRKSDQEILVKDYIQSRELNDIDKKVQEFFKLFVNESIEVYIKNNIDKEVL